MKLSAVFVRTVTKPRLYGDGGKLYLHVGETGSKSWLFRFMRNGKARAMGLGSANDVTLARARKKAAQCRDQLAAGQVKARNEQAAMAAIKALKVDLAGLNLFVREAALDHRPPKT